MKVFAALLLFLCLIQPVRAEDKVYGLLELGPLCWWECEGHDREVFLYKERSQYAAPALILKREITTVRLIEGERRCKPWFLRVSAGKCVSPT